MSSTVTSLRGADFIQVEESVAVGYLNIHGRYVAGSPVNDPLAARQALVVGAGVVIPPAPTYRTRDLSKIAMIDRTQSFTITDATLRNGMYGTPNPQGQYEIPLGNFRSTVPGVPVYKILASLPILGKNGNLYGWGMDATAQTGMVYCGDLSNFTVYNTMFFSGKPPAGYPGAMPAHDVVSENGANFQGFNCESHGTRGGLVATFKPPAVSGLASGTIRLDAWIKYNVDGRRVDGNGNWAGMQVANYLQVLNCKNLPDCLVTNWMIRNDPESGAQFEDATSSFNSYTAPGCHFIYDGFLVENSMPTDPRFVASGGTLSTIGIQADGSEIPYAGTGSLIGDQQDIPNLTEQTVCHGFKLLNGLVLTVANYGASIQAGWDQIIDRVHIISAGVIRSKAPGGFSRMAWERSGGFQVWNRTTNPVAPFHDNAVSNGDVGVDVLDKNNNFRQAYFEFYYPTNSGCTRTNVTRLPRAATPLDGLARMDAYRSQRIKAWTDSGIVLGCLDAEPFTAIRISTDPAV